ncbi:MAG: M1 family aminopeptidase [Deltaproteobacteria bacterium]
MRTLFLFSLFILSLLCVSTAWGFQDVRYDISARLDPRSSVVTGTEILSFVNDTGAPLREVFLRIYPNHKYAPREKRNLYKYASYFKAEPFPEGFEQGALAVGAVKDGAGAALPFAVEGADATLLRVTLSSPCPAGGTCVLTTDFTVTVPCRLGRFGRYGGIFALNRWYPLLAAREDGVWQKPPDYLLHMPYVSDAATYALTFAVPAGYDVISGCDETLGDTTAAGIRTVRLRSSAPLRELTLAVSNALSRYRIERNGVAIESYYLRKDEAQAAKAAAYAADMLAYYGERFGPYPYRKFSIVPVYLGYGGSQNAGLIFIDTRAYRMPRFLDRYFEFLITHETGHQWWYNVVGNDEFREVWLDEGLNSYGTLEYFKHKYGAGVKIVKMPAWLETFIPDPSFDDVRNYRYWYFAQKGWDAAIIQESTSFYEPSLIFTVAYGKGSEVVRMLAGLMGPQAFDAFLRRYAERFRFRIARVRDFIALAGEASGRDLGWFFDEWLYRPAVCDYAVVRHGKRLVLEKLGEVRMPVDVRLRYRDGTHTTLSFDGAAAEEDIPVDPAKRVAEAEADPAGRLLDLDRINNRYPRRLSIRFVPVYHPLYDVPLFLRTDRYTWLTGPSFSRFGIGVKSALKRPGDWTAYAAGHYDGNASLWTSCVGFEKNNLFRRYLSWGLEFIDRQALGKEEENLQSYKIYLRQELGLGYSLFEPNSHATLYFLHNRGLDEHGFIGEGEEARNLHYKQKRESVFGLTFHWSDAGAFPDPAMGFRLNSTSEVGGHVARGDDAFVRSSLEYSRYVGLGRGQVFAWRVKAGGGHPKDKYLFYLGSDRELRGYAYKSIQGSAMLLGSLEYRFPLAHDLDVRLPWNLTALDAVQGVVFFDAGTAWYDHFNEDGLRKDVGVGLRFYFNVAGAAERVGVRIDVARPLDGDDKDTRVWVGVNHAF